MKQRIVSFFKDRHGRVIVAQVPNAWLVGWILLAATSKLLAAGLVQTAVSCLASGLLLVWAVMEIRSGASNFRRVLGAVVLVGTIFSLLRRL